MEQLANDPELREQAKQTFAKSGPELRELQQLSTKSPDQMTAQGMHVHLLGLGSTLNYAFDV